MRATNHAIDEWRKKKDDKEKKQWAKERVKVQRGKRRQGSLEEEDEEEEEEEEGEMALGLPSHGMILLAEMRTHLCRRQGPSRGISWSKRGTHPRRRQERVAPLHPGLLRCP